MINFFRKIRQNLLAEGKTSKYLKYALGEIVLVVIGILIALQINNWNENRKAADEEIKILNALEADFMISKERIKETIIVQSRVMNYSKILIGIHERGDDNEIKFFDTHLDSLDKLINYGVAWYRAEPVTGAYNSLTSAGKIDLIQNGNLRSLLAQFIADYESGFEDQESTMFLLEKLNNETDYFILKIANNSFRKGLDLAPNSTDNYKISESFFSNDKYFGNLYLKMVLEYNRLERQNKMLEQVNSVLSIISEELANKQ
jgi:hypothetical protein